MGDRRLATTRRERELRQLSDALRAGDADVPNEGIHSRALLDAASLSSGQRVEARAKRSEIWRPAEVHKKQKGQRARVDSAGCEQCREVPCMSLDCPTLPASTPAIAAAQTELRNTRRVFSARRRSFAFQFSPPHPL